MFDSTAPYDENTQESHIFAASLMRELGKVAGGETARNALLFAISWSSVRTQGYGVKTEAPDLAMAVWPEFVRVRMEIGPSAGSMCNVHARLIEEHGQVPNVHPMPPFMQIADKTLHIHDFWNRTHDKKRAAGAVGESSIRAP